LGALLFYNFQKRIRNQFLSDRFVANMRFDVRFTFSRFPLRNMHRALEMMDRRHAEWKSWLFPEPDVLRKSGDGKGSLKLTVSSVMEGNPEQKLAVTKFGSFLFSKISQIGLNIT
jgi:hypothetical protein